MKSNSSLCVDPITGIPFGNFQGIIGYDIFFLASAAQCWRVSTDTFLVAWSISFCTIAALWVICFSVFVDILKSFHVHLCVAIASKRGIQASSRQVPSRKMCLHFLCSTATSAASVNAQTMHMCMNYLFTLCKIIMQDFLCIGSSTF